VTDQNEGGGAADEPLPRFAHYYSYSEYVPVCFKQEMVSDFGGALRPRNTVKVLDGGSSYKDFRKPSGLNIFVEKQYGSNWVQHEFIYG
jgi:hypothetical protein